jgi:hypothetical protein
MREYRAGVSERNNSARERDVRWRKSDMCPLLWWWLRRKCDGRGDGWCPCDERGRERRAWRIIEDDNAQQHWIVSWKDHYPPGEVKYEQMNGKRRRSLKKKRSWCSWRARRENKKETKE